MINEIVYPIIAFIVSVFITIICMPRLLRFCKHRGLYDMPNDRKLHQNKIPRLGGVLFVPATLIGVMSVIILLMLTNSHLPVFDASGFLIVSGIFLIYLIGILDDLFGLPASLKFGIQFIAALFLPLCGLYINNLYGFCGIYELPVIVSYPFTIFIVLLVVNAINLIDGIDGLASGVCLLALGVFIFLFGQMHLTDYVVFASALMGSVIVFFYYNMAGNAERFTKTFMGDAGSLMLGYALAYLAIKYAMNDTRALPYRADAILMAYTLLIIPCFDLIRVALGRLLRGTSIFHADKSHIHHRFLAAGFTMRQTLVIILFLQTAYIIINMLLCKLSVNQGIIVGLDIIIFLLLFRLLSLKENAHVSI